MMFRSEDDGDNTVVSFFTSGSNVVTASDRKLIETKVVRAERFSKCGT